jgi:hypothetical protein
MSFDFMMDMITRKPRVSKRILGLALCCAAVTMEAAEESATVSWSFRNHVQPVLAKTGCNAGACHGAAAGQARRHGG